MNEKIKLNKIPANDLLPYDYRIFMVLSEFENILSQTTRDLMMKNSKGFTHKHVHKTEPKILFDVEKEADELCESSSFKEYNLVFENFISQTIRHGHERYHHETLILDASLNHIPVYSHLKTQPTISICSTQNYALISKIVEIENLEELDDITYMPKE